MSITNPHHVKDPAMLAAIRLQVDASPRFSQDQIDTVVSLLHPQSRRNATTLTTAA